MNRPDPREYGLFELDPDSEQYKLVEKQYRTDVDVYQGRREVAMVLAKRLAMAQDLDIDDLAYGLHALGHKTLEQNAGRGLKKLIAAFATRDYDERNEATVRMAQAAAAVVDDIVLPYI
jgi:hypothetical protein